MTLEEKNEYLEAQLSHYCEEKTRLIYLLKRCNHGIHSCSNVDDSRLLPRPIPSQELAHRFCLSHLTDENSKFQRQNAKSCTRNHRNPVCWLPPSSPLVNKGQEEQTEDSDNTISSEFAQKSKLPRKQWAKQINKTVPNGNEQPKQLGKGQRNRLSKLAAFADAEACLPSGPKHDSAPVTAPLAALKSVRGQSEGQHKVKMDSGMRHELDRQGGKISDKLNTRSHTHATDLRLSPGIRTSSKVKRSGSKRNLETVPRYQKSGSVKQRSKSEERASSSESESQFDEEGDDEFLTRTTMTDEHLSNFRRYGATGRSVSPNPPTRASPVGAIPSDQVSLKSPAKVSSKRTGEHDTNGVNVQQVLTSGHRPVNRKQEGDRRKKAKLPVPAIVTQRTGMRQGMGSQRPNDGNGQCEDMSDIGRKVARDSSGGAYSALHPVHTAARKGAEDTRIHQVKSNIELESQDAAPLSSLRVDAQTPSSYHTKVERPVPPNSNSFDLKHKQKLVGDGDININKELMERPWSKSKPQYGDSFPLRVPQNRAPSGGSAATAGSNQPMDKLKDELHPDRTTSAATISGSSTRIAVEENVERFFIPSDVVGEGLHGNAALSSRTWSPEFQYEKYPEKKLDMQEYELSETFPEMYRKLQQTAEMDLQLQHLKTALREKNEASRKQEIYLTLLRRQLDIAQSDLNGLREERDEMLKTITELSGLSSRNDLDGTKVEFKANGKNGVMLRNRIQRYIEEVRQIENLLEWKEEENQLFLEQFVSLRNELLQFEGTHIGLEPNPETLISN